MISIKKTWVYLLKQNSQDFDAFKSFKAMVEKESDNFIKFLRSDRGGEYMPNEFMDFFNIMELKESLLLATLHNKTE